MRFHKLVPRDKVRFEDCRKNEELLNKIDAEAREKGELKFRVIQEPCADSYAIYQVIRVGKKNCRIEQVSVGSDDWSIPYWGQEAVVDRSYVEQKLQWADKWNAIFEAKRKEQNS